MRERQQREQAAHENHAGVMQIHQPVAVPPSTRTIHNVLGQSGALGGPNGLSGPMNGQSVPGGVFGNVPVQQGETTPRMQHAVQLPPQVMAFGAPPGPMAMGQGQQPILNVSCHKHNSVLCDY
jgi:paired amphipathic helix protein Sin3a